MKTPLILSSGLFTLSLVVAACSGGEPGNRPEVASATEPVASAPAAPSTTPEASEPAAGGRREHRGFRDGDEHARGGPPSPEKLIGRFDANKNGTLEASEVPDRMKEHFAEIDTNKDGSLSKEELVARFQGMADHHFAEKDKNGDGMLDAIEVGPERWQHLSAADTNGDGKVSKEELRAAFEAGKLKPHRGPGDAPAAKATPAE